MTSPDHRAPSAEIHPQFIERWSPRAFRDDPVPDETLQSLFEAARWAPSCFNEQPWLFLYATGGEELERFRGLLVDGNRTWADRAPVLGFVLARKNFTRNGKPNRWAAFDSGAAWMSLALQAHALGLAAHGMGGFKLDEAYAGLDVPPDRYEIVCAFALGRPGDPSILPEDLRAREKMSDRKDPALVALRGAMPADFNATGGARA